jgi:hypothetical protein
MKIVIFAFNSGYYKAKDAANHLIKYSRIEQNKKKAGQALNVDDDEENDSDDDEDMFDDIEEDEGSDPSKGADKKRYTLSALLKNSPSPVAYIDFLSQYIYQKFSNSVESFYRFLFKEISFKEYDHESLDPEREVMLGTDVKAYYEKYCFLNHFVELKLTDPTNERILKKKGFEIITEDNRKTEMLLKVELRFHDAILVESPPDDERDSLQIFFESMIKVTNFDDDQLSLEHIKRLYSKFCELNGMAPLMLSSSILGSRYNLKSEKVATQVVRRKEKISELRGQNHVAELVSEDEKFKDKSKKHKKNKKKQVVKAKKIFVIDKTKLEDNFALVSHQYENIDPKRLDGVLREYVLFKFWRFWDIVTVLLDMVWIGLVTVPTLLISIWNEASYAPYSLNDPIDLVTVTELTKDTGTIFLKILYQGWTWNLVLTCIVITFWLISFIDLIIYYSNLTFPMDDTFRKAELVNRHCLQRFARKLEWILLLCALSFYFGYIGLLGTWWLLGAIISPSAFLPYASGAITFLTFVKGKYAQFNKIVKKGRQAVLGYMEKFMANIMSKVMKKISEKMEGTTQFVADKAKGFVQSDSFNKMTDVLSNSGIVDPKDIEKFKSEVETIDAGAIMGAAGGAGGLSVNP